MSGRDRLTVVVPVFHNAESLPLLHRRLVAIEERAGVELSVLYVDDRSLDNSYDLLRELCASDPRVRVIRLSRNFGSFTAIRAGLDHLPDGEAVAFLSADLQDPPELLVEMVNAWRDGADVVLAVRRRRGDPWWTRQASRFFYWLLRTVALPDMPQGGFDFLVVDRRVALVLRQFRELNTSLVGLVLWLGFERKLIQYDRAERPYGKSMWTLVKKARYAVDSIVAFSAVPLRLASAIGILSATLSFAWCAWVVFQAIFLGRPAVGWSSLMAATCFLGGVQLLALGIVGEYLWRNIEETRKRPLYIVDAQEGFDDESTDKSRTAQSSRQVAESAACPSRFAR